MINGGAELAQRSQLVVQVVQPAENSSVFLDFFLCSSLIMVYAVNDAARIPALLAEINTDRRFILPDD